MNPAPTLLDEWITPTGFAVIVLLLLIAAIGVVIAENLRDHREDEQNDDNTSARNFCVANGCQYEAVDGVWVCTNCGDVVRQPLNCAGRHRYIERGQSLLCTVCGYRTALPYDQDLDQATDLGQWEKEMPA